MRYTWPNLQTNQNLLQNVKTMKMKLRTETDIAIVTIITTRNTMVC